MPEEGEAQIGIGPDALEPLVGVDGSLLDGVGAQVGEFARLEVAPDQLDGVEIVPVARKAARRPTSGVVSAIHACITLDRCEGSPSQIKVTLSFPRCMMEVFEELDERILVVGTGPHIEDEPGVGAVGGEADGGGHRETLPAEAVVEHGGATPGRPGRPHRGEEAEPALVLETDPGFAASGDYCFSARRGGRRVSRSRRVLHGRRVRFSSRSKRGARSPRRWLSTQSVTCLTTTRVSVRPC